MRDRNYVGASEVATVCGLSPFMTARELFLIKTGQRESPGPTAHTLTGELLEPVILKEASERGLINIDTSQASIECAVDGYPIVAHPDAITVDGEPVEVKATGVWGRAPVSVPIYYSIQVQTQAIACGKDRGHLVRLVGGAGLFYDVISVDHDLMTRAFSRVKQFWGCVTSGIWDESLDVPLSLGQDPETEHVEGDEALLSLAARLVDAYQKKRECEGIYNDLREEFIERVGRNKCVTACGYVIKTKEVKRQSFDSRGLAAEYPELYNRFRVQSESVTLEIKEV